MDEHTQRPLKAIQCPALSVTEALHSGGEAHNLSEKLRPDAYYVHATPQNAVNPLSQWIHFYQTLHKSCF